MGLLKAVSGFSPGKYSLLVSSATFSPRVIALIGSHELVKEKKKPNVLPRLMAFLGLVYAAVELECIIFALPISLFPLVIIFWVIVNVFCRFVVPLSHRVAGSKCWRSNCASWRCAARIS